VSTATQSELTAIREAAAFTLLREAGPRQDAHAFLRITGSDAARWLNGMVTNSIQSLAPGEGNYNFLLNAQGRIQGDCTIYRDTNSADPTGFLLATTAAQLEPIQQHLDRFIIMDDVELTPAFTAEYSLLLLGPAAPAILQRLDLPALDPLHLAPADTPHGPVLLLTPAAGSIPKYELRAPEATLDAIREVLLAAAVPQVSAAALETLRILEAVPLYGQDIRNSETARDLPQETAQNHALHFSKGCYLGQEIVERIHSRGQVHRTFTQFRLTPDNDSQASPRLPAALQSNGKPAGELTSAALTPGLGVLALGYVRREALDLHQTLTYDGGVAEPIPAASKN
jgi:folate-binding protein YgfZ